MRRGDVVWVELGNPTGAEASSRRPAVIVSNDGANRSSTANGRGVLNVVPLTTNVQRVLSFQVFLPGGTCGLPADSKAQCEQVRAVDVQRLSEPIGRVTAVVADQLDDALRLQLVL